MGIEQSVEAGMKAENYFASILNEKGIFYNFDDDWYDFMVNKVKVEVKSCRISVKDVKHHFRPGRFDFTNEENRKKQYKENIWICLIARHQDQFILLGFVKAKQLKMKRYLSLPNARGLSPMSFDDWLKKINR